MRMMGAESVEYHRATVLGRADDHPGMAMSTTRPEVRRRSSGVARQRRARPCGPVTAEGYEAVFGPAGPGTLAPENGS